LQSGEDSGPGSGLAGWRHSPAPADCGPLGGFHTGQPGGLFQGAAARFMGLLDAGAKKPAPGLAGGEVVVVSNVNSNTHIHEAPDRRAPSSKSGAAVIWTAR
jgi:hypothetical protein